jgi:hypothetical protein
MITPSSDPRSAPSGMFTRNLIGSLSVSAFKLMAPAAKDEDKDELGIWFILQDLSVRTEGTFRYGCFSYRTCLRTPLAPSHRFSSIINTSSFIDAFNRLNNPLASDIVRLSYCIGKY